MSQLYYSIVESAINSLGVNPKDCADETQPGLWRIKKGSASIEVTLFAQENTGKIYSLVSAWVAKIPQEAKVDFYEDLLELNGQYVGVSFCKMGNDIFVITDREAEGMDATELSAMIHRVANVADHYDDFFKQKYPAN